VKKKKKKKKRSKLLKFFYPASVLAVMLACAYVLVPGFRELASVRAQVAALERAYQEKSAANASLKKEIASMNTAEGIERAARRYLRAAKPDEVIFVFKPPHDENSTEK
jgi:cell division protein FtsB